MTSQLSLALRLRDDATFTNFLATENNRRLVADLLSSRQPPEVHLVYLWGSEDTGISHLLQAACHFFADRGAASQYLPLTELKQMDGDQVLDGLERQSLVCIDGVQEIGEIAEWQRALFNLYNRMAEAGSLLVVAADCPPSRLPIRLQDLVSRLSSGLVFHLPVYRDDEKLEILRFRAGRLGLDITDEVAGFLYNRCSRKLEDLMSLLRQLDVASLEAKRRLTIPFIKQVLNL